MASMEKGRRTIPFLSVVHLEASRLLLILRHSLKIHLRIKLLLQTVAAWRAMRSHWPRSKIKIKWAFNEPTRVSRWSTSWTRPTSWQPLGRHRKECPCRSTLTARIMWSQLGTDHPAYNLCKKNRSYLFGHIPSRKRHPLAAPRKANKIKWLQAATILQTKVDRTLGAKSRDLWARSDEVCESCQ